MAAKRYSLVFYAAILVALLSTFGVYRVLEVTKANAMPPQDPELWRAHGMELVGPPLQVR